MNIPNTLSLIRCFLVPVFVATLLFMRDIAIWGCIIPAVVYGLTALTDMLDGKIARKYNLVTDFGKFLDPLADKFMVIGAMFVILYRSLNAETPDKLFCNIFFWSFMVLIFRELAVTSIRLVVSSSSGVVIAANMLGKIKTCTQIACVICCLAEPMIYRELGKSTDFLPVSIVTAGLMLIFTLWSGITYLSSYWKYMDPEK